MCRSRTYSEVSAHLSLNGTDFLVDRCHFEGRPYLGVSIGRRRNDSEHLYRESRLLWLYVTSVNGEINIGLHLSVVNCYH